MYELLIAIHNRLGGRFVRRKYVEKWDSGSILKYVDVDC
jgi:hypothetical protein